MYLDHFGLRANPFSLSPRLDFLFRSEAFEESIAHLVYGVDNGEPLVMITGPIGTGKTMAIQSFLSHLGDHFETALVTNTRVNGLELLKLILDDLGVGLTPGADKSDLLIAFKEHLLANSAAGRRVLVVVDEAQNLTTDALEEIRLLTNLGQGDQQPVQLVLVGQPELEAVVNSPELAQLRQRIRVHYRLEPLTRSELDGYVRHRMTVAGCARDAFAGDALDRIYRLSRGVPRLVNTLANEGLLAAYVDGRDKVRAADVDLPGAQEVSAAAGGDAPIGAVATAPDVEFPDLPPERRPARTDHDRLQGRHGRRAAAWAVPVVVLAVAGVAAGLYFLTDMFSQAPAAAPAETPVAAAEAPAAAIEVPVPAAPDSVVVQAVSATATGDSVPAAVVAAPAARAEPAPIVADGVWCVHVGSFRTEDRAASYTADLAAHAPGAFHRFETVRGVGWHRVFVGPYAERTTALAEANRLQGELGIQYYKIVRTDAAGDS